jgi:hypothetical protein
MLYGYQAVIRWERCQVRFSIIDSSPVARE